MIDCIGGRDVVPAKPAYSHGRHKHQCDIVVRSFFHTESSIQFFCTLTDNLW